VVPPSFSDSPVTKKNNKQERELLKEYRELIGLTSSYARDEERSRFISQATSYFDPRVSSLFEIGHARLWETVRWKVRLRTVPIAAMASGENGNVLSFCAIDDEPMYRHYEGESSLNFRVPTISTSNTVDWFCGEAPIRQIRFAESFEESEGLFAARLLSCTSIFRPIYYQEPLVIDPPKIAEGAHSKDQLAHIDPNLVTEIDISQTGGHAHADVTFNPWYQKQFAIIDERGNWSIWLLPKLVQNREGITPERQHSGSLPSFDVTQDEDQDNTDQMPHDGWGKIEWVGDISTFIACGRRTAMLYVAEGATPVSYGIHLNWQSSTEWILDVKPFLQKPSHVFILTTLRILCFDISSREHESSFVLPQFSWQHDRDAEDLTLRFTSLSVGQGRNADVSAYELITDYLFAEYYLLLYSRLDSCILAFQVPINDSDDPNSSMSDPFYIIVPGVPDTNGLQTIRYKFPIRQVLFRELDQTPMARVQLTQRERLMKLFVLDHALAVHEYVFAKPYDISSSEGETAVNRDKMSFGKALELFRRREGRTAMRSTFDDGSDKTVTRKPRSKTREDSLAVDLNRMYVLLSTSDTRYVKKSLVPAPEFQSFGEYVEHLVTAVSASAEDGPAFMQTM
jgi:RNA polymerase I-specific transcription initiation factor RRN6